MIRYTQQKHKMASIRTLSDVCFLSVIIAIPLKILCCIELLRDLLKRSMMATQSKFG